MMYADRTMMHVIYCYVVLVGSWNICLDLWSQNVPSDSAAQIIPDPICLQQLHFCSQQSLRAAGAGQHVLWHAKKLLKKQQTDGKNANTPRTQVPLKTSHWI